MAGFLPNFHLENLMQRARSRLDDAALARGDPVSECQALAQVRDDFQFIHTAVASQFDLLVRFSRIGKQRDIADRFLSGVLNIGLRICMAHATRDSIECERGSDSYCGSLGFVDQ